MYERSASVLERYFNSILGLDQKINLQTIFEDYKELIEKTKKYQEIIENEDKIIEEFDKAASEIENIQQEQKKIYKNDIKLEEERNQLFDSLDEEPVNIEKKLKKVESSITANNVKLEELREAFINALTIFSEKQTERNKYSRTRRTIEKEHLQTLDKTNNDINEIDNELISSLKEFTNLENEDTKNEIIQKMINNGKGERVPFNTNVIEKAVKIKIEITRKKAELYILIYEKIKKILIEINSDEIKLGKYEKNLRDTSVKLSYLEAENNYIISFLDNERMTAINGKKVHEKLMADACENFDLDIKQFSNLYELILKETSGKSTKKAYNELYNKEYLKNIEEKEKNFEKEINSIKINTSAIINSNYWRIEEIKNIYNVFKKEITEKFDKDLSEFKLEESEEIAGQVEEVIQEEQEEKDDIFKKNISDEETEYIEEYEEDYDSDDNEEYDEYEDEDNEEDDYYNENDDDNNIDYDDDDYEYDDEDDYEFDDDEEYEEYEDDEYDEDDVSDGDNNEQEDQENHNIDKNKKQNKGLFNKFFKDKK